MKRSSFACVATALVLAACSPRPDSSSTPAPAAPAAAPTPTAQPPAPSDGAGTLVGKWTGPEGTSLEITPAATGYQVTVTNLDGPRAFPGTAEGDGVAFTRDGQRLVVRKGTGAETGMKWLDGKTDCVVVQAGEGYCRD